MEENAHRGRMWKVMGHEQFKKWNVGVFFLSQEHNQGRFLKMRRGTGKKDYKVSGNRNPFQRGSGASQRKCGHGMWRPNDAVKLFVATRDGSWEGFRKGCREKEKSSAWTVKKIREAFEKVAKEEIGRFDNVQENLRKSKDFLWRTTAPVGGKGRSHLVVYLPARQQVHLGGLYLVGFGRTRRQEQEEEEALQLVVRGLWRQIRMDSTQLDSGGAASSAQTKKRREFSGRMRSRKDFVRI